MKSLLLIALASLLLISCKKNETTPTPTLDPVVDNGPLGGTYTYKSLLVVTNDTIIEPGQFGGPSFEVATERTYTSTSCTGKLTITKTNLKSDGLISNYGYTTTGTKKNLTTGAISILTYLPSSDTRGASTTSYNSNYTFSIAGAQLNITDGQYVFNPAFQIQPTDKNYRYTFLANELTVNYEYYSASNRTKNKTTAVFTKN